MAQYLRHVVLFSFLEDASPAQVDSVVRMFCELPLKINIIHSFEWGKNISQENATHGFEYCFIVTFLTEQDRDIYLPHPEHQRFVKYVQPYIKDVLVHDFWASV